MTATPCWVNLYPHPSLGMPYQVEKVVEILTLVRGGLSVEAARATHPLLDDDDLFVDPDLISASYVWMLARMQTPRELEDYRKWLIQGALITRVDHLLLVQDLYHEMWRYFTGGND